MNPTVKSRSIAPTSALSSSATEALSRLESALAPELRAGDSDPFMNEALRRVRRHGSALREGMAAYREWAESAA